VPTFKTVTYHSDINVMFMMTRYAQSHSFNITLRVVPRCACLTS